MRVIDWAIAFTLGAGAGYFFAKKVTIVCLFGHCAAVIN